MRELVKGRRTQEIERSGHELNENSGRCSQSRDGEVAGVVSRTESCSQGKVLATEIRVLRCSAVGVEVAPVPAEWCR